MKYYAQFITGIVLSLLVTVGVTAETIHVPGEQPTIQDGLNAATSGDTVLVAAGTYFENIIWPDVNGIKLFGADIDNTIIDGNDQASVLRFDTGNIIDTTTVVRGFTLTNGNALPPWPQSQGGGICIFASSPILEYLNIVGNTADDFGGGIYIWGSSSNPIIRYVVIANNTAISHGGVDCAAGAPLFDHVTVSGNDPGGMYFDTNGYARMENSIVALNSLFSIRVQGTTFEPTTIIIGYSDTYGSVQLIGVASINWLEGNINTDPLFVDPGAGDYHLQAESPCIDAGDPSYSYDPDGTITDMGAFYFHQYNVPQIELSTNLLDYGPIPVSTEADQSLILYNTGDATLVLYDIYSSDPTVFFTDFNPADSLVMPGDSLIITVTFAPQEITSYEADLTIENNDELKVVSLLGEGIGPVDITLTPYNPPIIIPESGGSFDFNIAVENLTALPQTFDFWTQIELPNVGVIEILNIPGLSLPGNTILDRDRMQVVPAAAPAGIYTYNAYVGVYNSWIVQDYDFFTFEKLGSGEGGPLGLSSDWPCTGEDFETWLAAPEIGFITEFALHGVYPNPFNPTTTIGYQISAVSFVNLSVYDISGRKVAELVNGWRDEGVQEVTFDGSSLASGIYVYRLEAGQFSAVGKMMLVK